MRIIFSTPKFFFFALLIGLDVGKKKNTTSACEFIRLVTSELKAEMVEERFTNNCFNIFTKFFWV